MSFLISLRFGLDRSIGFLSTAGSTLLLSCLVVGSALAAPQPELIFTNGGEKIIDELVPGDDLWVTISSLPTNLEVQVQLLDEYGATISALEENTGPQGKLSHLLLWFRSGVVGCDSVDDVDPEEYRYVDFAQAELFLENRVFDVRVVDGHGLPLVEEALPTRSEPRTRYFFSDSRGCPRDEFEFEEDVYLSALNAFPRQDDTAIFLVDSERPLTSDGRFQEVRGAYRDFPQVLSPSVAGENWTVAIWEGDDSIPGIYGIFVRLFSGYLDPFWNPEDAAVGVDPLSDDISLHGIVIKSWACPAGDDLCSENDPPLPLGAF